jgi:hypothetical protein
MPPLSNIADLSSFMDDNYIVRWNSNIDDLKKNMKKSLSRIITWLGGSSLKVKDRNLHLPQK